MEVRYHEGVRIGSLTFDPTRAVESAFFTHRPVRRPTVTQAVMSAPLAARWPGALGVPFHQGVVAMGLRIEVLPSGYGPGGAAVIATRAGHRTLVIGPVASTFEPQPADTLVLYAPEPVRATEVDWVGAACLGQPLTLATPDAAAAFAVSLRLTAAGVPHRRPAHASPDAREGPRTARVQVAIGGSGVDVDARPQLDEEALVGLVGRVDASSVLLHGPRSEALARRLGEAGIPCRVLSAPRQLTFPGLSPAWPR